MSTAPNQHLQTNGALESLTPLHLETRSALPTREAAYHLNRKQQTLRIWACRENGPIRPIRVHGRLAWRVADIRKLIGGCVMASPKGSNNSIVIARYAPCNRNG